MQSQMIKSFLNTINFEMIGNDLKKINMDLMSEPNKTKEQVDFILMIDNLRKLMLFALNFDGSLESKEIQEEFYLVIIQIHQGLIKLINTDELPIEEQKSEFKKAINQLSMIYPFYLLLSNAESEV